MSPAVLRANPFMLPVNLADRAVELAQQSEPSADTLTLEQAEQLLLSTSLLPAVRSIKLRSSCSSESRFDGACSPLWSSLLFCSRMGAPCFVGVLCPYRCACCAAYAVGCTVCVDVRVCMPVRLGERVGKCACA